MGRTQTEIVGFGENTRKNLRKIGRAMNAAGFDVDAADAILTQAVQECVDANAEQEEAKRVLKGKTVAVVVANQRLYTLSSGYLDAGIAAVGKTSPDAVVLRRLRSRIRLPASAVEATAQEPLPEAAQ